MHRLTTFLVWIVIGAVGYFGVDIYKQKVSPYRETMEDKIKKFTQDWKDAMSRPLRTLPPALEEIVKRAPGWQHEKLQEKLTEIQNTYEPGFKLGLQNKQNDLVSDFQERWEDAIKNFDDSPNVDETVEPVHERYQKDLRARLTKIDNDMKARHPRDKLALDSFSGYAVLRSQEFRAPLLEQGIRLHLVDDEAVYSDRIRKLQSGETPLAVFTIDALITNSAVIQETPATIVMLIDDSQGADAMVAYKKAIPDLTALNHEDTHIVLLPDSPSETLARVVRTQFFDKQLKEGVREKPKGTIVPVDAKGGINEVVKAFREAKDTDRQAFVLWEPYVSRVLKDSKGAAHVLVDSSQFRGYIVDVLVVQKKYLEKNRDKVQKIVKAYLNAAHEHAGNMPRLVKEDWQRFYDQKKVAFALTDEQAQGVVRGIWWRNTVQNYGHFGLLPAGQSGDLQPIDEMVKNIGKVLAKSGACAQTWPPEAFFDKSICEALHKEKFSPADETIVRKVEPKPVVPAVEAPALQRVELPVNEIPFRRGSPGIEAGAETVLAEIVEAMKNWPNSVLEVRGHARGDTEADRELARQRAETVAKWLYEQGNLPKDRVKIVEDAKEKTGDGNASVTFTMLTQRQ